MRAYLRLLTGIAAVGMIALAGCSGGSSNSGSGGTTTPPLTTTLTLSATSLTFTGTVGTASATQTITVTSTGTAPISFTSVAITGANASAFTETTNCGSAVSTSCTVTVGFKATAAGPSVATLVFTDTATGSPQSVLLTGTATVGGLTYTLSLSTSALTFASANVGLTASQSVTVTNTGTGYVYFQGNMLTGTNASLFGNTTTCNNLAPAATCTVTVTYTPTGSGSSTASLLIADNALAGGVGSATQTVTLNGTAISTAAAGSTADCSTTTGSGATSTGGPCTALTIQGDPIAAGGFHGYADPSLRKDPNAGLLNLAYSWARTLADGTHVVELHLASSTNSATSFTEVGTLWPTTTYNNTTSTAYAAGTNYTSHEVVDLIPIPGTGATAGQTVWVQAHEEYLVKPQAGIYDQRDATLYISVSAVNVPNPASPGTTLTGLYTAPEARLGAVSVDASRSITQRITGLSTALSKCATLGQPALWYQSGVLYLALECGENTTLGYDAHELSHYLFTTTPTGADATQWTWAYAGELATPAQAGKMGAQDGTPYSFFTEPEFVQGKSGQLYFIVTPGVFAPQTAQQPVIQYGCRAVPVTALSATGATLATDTTTGVLSYTAKVTESDLYGGVNEGPAACTYDPNSILGIVIGRKYENDPTLGFDIFPVGSGVNP